MTEYYPHTYFTLKYQKLYCHPSSQHFSLNDTTFYSHTFDLKWPNTISSTPKYLSLNERKHYSHNSYIFHLKWTNNIFALLSNIYSNFVYYDIMHYFCACHVCTHKSHISTFFLVSPRRMIKHRWNRFHQESDVGLLR